MNPGYKQTELGIVPEEWEVSDLQKVCRETITYGIVQCGPHIKDGVPYIRVSDMDEPELDVERMLRTSPAIASKFVRSKVAEGDLVYALRGKIGEVRQVRSDLAGANLTQGTARLSPSDQIARGYFIWAMRNPRSVRQAGLEAKGTTFREITLADLRHIQILAPPLPEQRAIAEALRDVDALLGALDRLIGKKRDLKQAAMQQLLTGQTRLPGFHGEWEVKRLGDVCRITTGKKDVNEGNPDGQFPFFTCSRSHTFSDSYSFDTEAILIAGNGEVGNLHYFKGKFEAYQRTYVLSEFAAHVRYLWQQLSAYLAGSLGLGKIGSSIPYIKKENLVDFEFKSPRDTSEQIAIAEVLSDMDTELVALEQRREKTLALKQAMMQQLLTGRTRLV
jgi:type I restriction enzyme, S subunit